MRVYPALRLTYFDTPAPEQLDGLLAELDEFHPTALDDIENGVVAYFSGASDRDAACKHFTSFELLDAVSEDVPDQNWAERSQAALTPVTVGRLTVAPPWTVTDELRASVPGPIIVIQPSMGFGTGHHASTRLCLELLQTIPLEGRRVLDIGTGSGVLAIAASILGAAEATGIDVDSDALDNARENVELNSQSSVALFEGDANALEQRVAERADIILANLTGGLLLREADVITRLAGPGARLIISGIQLHEREGIEAAFEAAGWRAADRRESESWVAVHFERQSR